MLGDLSTSLRPCTAFPRMGNSFLTTSVRVDGTSMARTATSTTTPTPTSSAVGEGSLMLPNESRPAHTRKNPARATWPTNPGTGVQPHRRRGHRGVDALALHVADVHRHAAEPCRGDLAGERRRDLRGRGRPHRHPVGHGAEHGHRGGEVGAGRRQEDRHEPVPVGVLDLGDDAGEVGELRDQEVEDRRQHDQREDLLRSEPGDRLQRGLGHLATRLDLSRSSSRRPLCALSSVWVAPLSAAG